MGRARAFALVALIGALGVMTAACAAEPPPPASGSTTTAPTATTVTTPPSSSGIVGTYSGQFATVGTVKIQRSGSGSAANYTVATTSSLRLVGASCDLAPGTVLARFGGTGPTFSAASNPYFNATSCLQTANFYSGSTVLNADGSVTITIDGRVTLLTRTGNTPTVSEPNPSGNYTVTTGSPTGSTGTVAVRRSGTGTTANHTVIATSSFKLAGNTCTVAAGTVIARFTGTGPDYNAGNPYFNATSCLQTANFYSGIAWINDDNSITITLNGTVNILNRTGTTNVVTNPNPSGNYTVTTGSPTGSTGTVAVRRSGTGTTANHTVIATSSFKLAGNTCTVAAGTVIARFTGAGPDYNAGNPYFNATSCLQTANFYSGIAWINDDNSITITLNGTVNILNRTGTTNVVTNPSPSGNYTVTTGSPTGSTGTVAVTSSGSGASLTHTVTTTSAFKLAGNTCTVASGTVIARFTGAGPDYNAGNPYFNATSCVPTANFYSGIAWINDDNSITITLNGVVNVLTR